MLIHEWNLPFVFLATADETFITSAMRKLENYVAINNVRCVQFRPKVSTDTDYITIIDNIGCSSPVSNVSRIEHIS